MAAGWHSRVWLLLRAWSGLPVAAGDLALLKVRKIDLRCWGLGANCERHMSTLRVGLCCCR